MEQIEIAPIPSSLTVTFDQNKVFLPAETRTKVDQHWQWLIAQNPKLRNGEVFTVTSVEQTGDVMKVALAETDYAHYLYSQQVGGLGEYAVRIIHPAALVVTADNMFVFGAMGEHTSSPGVIQCCGGGIDHSDIKDGVVDMQHAIGKELSEELGISIDDESQIKSFYAAYLKSGGPTGKMTVCYILRSRQTSNDFKRNYERFVKELQAHGEEPEFGELFYLANDESAIEAFIAEYSSRLNECMTVIFRAAYKDLR